MAGFKCPKCSTPNNKIQRTYSEVKTIDSEKISIVRRARKCDRCGKIWYTVEVLETDCRKWIPIIGDKNPLHRPERKDETDPS